MTIDPKVREARKEIEDRALAPHHAALRDAKDAQIQEARRKERQATIREAEEMHRLGQFTEWVDNQKLEAK